MRIQELDSSLIVLLVACALLFLPACHVNVHKNADESEKKVDIDTPIGGIHVSQAPDVKNIGLPIYPGARPIQKEEEGQEKSANVSISTSFFGLKVAAQEFESNDPPEKLLSFYNDALKRYGAVLTCHGPWHGGGDVNVKMGKDKSTGKSGALSCNNESGGTTTELKVGTEDNEHLVEIEAKGKGSKFALVHVEVHGREGTI
jgi:hypothetical protein